MHAGAPEGLRDWLDPYFDAGARHVVLRVADEEPRRGLEAAAAALPLLTDQIGANPEGDRSP